MEELEQLHSDNRRELFHLRTQKATGQLENPVRLRTLRRDVARIQTLLNEKKEQKV